MILARHAESLFWAGRFLERAEITSRWLDVASRSAMHLVAAEADSEWSRLIDALGLKASYGDHGYDQATISSFLLSDPTSPGSVRTSTESMRDNLRVARDRVPVELWEAVNHLHTQLSAFQFPDALDGAPTEIFRTVREGCQAISGVLSESMMRDEGHAFIMIGRMIERALLTAQLLTTTVKQPAESFDADRVLRSCSALQAFRRLHGHNESREIVIEFLLTTPNLPRSILSCLRHAEGRLNALSLRNHSSAMTLPKQVAGRIRSNLEYGELDFGIDERRSNVVEDVHRGLLELGSIIGTQVFRPLGEPVLRAQFVRPGYQPS